MGTYHLMGVLAQGGQGGNTWSITNILANATDLLQTWGSLIIFLLGIACIIVAAYKLFTGLASHGQKQTSWAVVIILFIVGGVFTFSGAQGAWSFVAGTVAGGGRTTLDDLSSQSGNTNPTIGVGAGNTIVFGEDSTEILLAA